MKYIILSDHMWSWNWVTADPNCHNYTYTFFLFSIERDIKVLGYQIFPACVVGHLNEKNWVILFVSVIFVGKLKKMKKKITCHVLRKTMSRTITNHGGPR